MKKINAFFTPILLLFLLVNGLLLVDRSPVSASSATNPVFSGPGSEQAGPPWFDVSWSYRRPVTITNDGAAQTNYQVLVKLDGTFDFSHANADGSDLRVTAADGVSELSYWIEDWFPGLQKAWVWVKIPSLEVGASTIYLYYGNTSATTTADGKSTFVAYDGFEGYAIGEIPTGYDGNPGQWTRYAGNPVLTTGPTGAWDASGSTFASVIYDETAGEYRMYYHGWGTTSPCSSSCVGLATSPDGLTWTRYAFNPVMTPGPSAWDGSGVRVPMVWKEGANDYRMIYTGSGSGGLQIGYATSTNGINWTKYAGNPVFNDPTWAHGSTENWGVIKVGTEYLMWYSDLGAPRESGIAVSTDLINWTPYQSAPIFATSGDPADWRYSQFCPFTFIYGGFYYVLMPSYNSGSDYSRYYLYRSSSPYFPESDRTLIRIAHMVAPNQWDSTDNDTPMVLTDDIQRTVLHNNQLWTYYSSFGTKWQEGLLIEPDIAAALAPADLPGTGLSWSYSATPPSTISVVDAPVHQGVRSVQLHDTSTGATLLRGSFEQLLQGAAGAWMRRPTSTAAGDFDIYLYGGAGPTGVAGLGRNGTFHYWDGTFHDTAISWQVDTWYYVSLTFDVITDTYDFVVYEADLDELVRVEDIAFGNQAAMINAAEFYTGSTFIGDTYGDDYRIRLDMGVEPIIQFGSEQGMIDLGVEKIDYPDPIYAGDALTYILTITNSSLISATSVVVTDTLPVEVQLATVDTSQGDCILDNPVVCNLNTIPANATAQITIVVTTTLEGLITNNAIMDSPDYDLDFSDNSDQAETTILARADLAVSKTDDPDPAGVGDPLTYTLTVQNLEISTAQSVVLTDTLPAEVSLESIDPDQGDCSFANPVVCNLGNIAGGSSVQVVIVVTPILEGILTNVVLVETPTYEADLANNTDTETTNVAPQADLSLTKTDNPDPVIAGELLTYTLNIENAGPSLATNVQVVDSLPEGVEFVSSDPPPPTCLHPGGEVNCDLGDIPMGTSEQITIIVQVQASQLDPLVNIAQVSSDTYDPDMLDNQATATTLVQTSADLGIGMTSDPVVVRDGVPITYTLWLTNNGPSDATGVTVTDTLPLEVTYVGSQPPVCTRIGRELTCPLGVLAGDAISQLDILANMGTGGGSSIFNQAGVFSSNTADPDLENNYAELSLPVDNVLPVVNWVEPVGNGGTYYVHGEIVTLLVTANDFDGSGVDYVWFYFYDPANNRITIAFDYTFPYTVDFDTSVLPFDYTTQTYARAYDMAGNEGERVRINFIRIPLGFIAFLPLLAK